MICPRCGHAVVKAADRPDLGGMLYDECFVPYYKPKRHRFLLVRKVLSR